MKIIDGKALLMRLRNPKKVTEVISKSREEGNLGDFTEMPPIWDDIGDNIWKAVGFAKAIEILAFTHYR